MAVDDVSEHVAGNRTQEAASDGADPSQEVMALLSEHVPLTLLADLALPEGPHSEEIITEEGLPEVAWWEQEGDTSARPKQG